MALSKADQQDAQKTMDRIRTFEKELEDVLAASQRLEVQLCENKLVLDVIIITKGIEHCRRWHSRF